MERLIFITVTCFFLLSFVMHKERVYNPGLEADIPSVGKQIAEARLKKGYSQSELASLLEVSTYNIECVENDKAVPVRGLIVKIQEVLDCEIVMDGPFRKDEMTSATPVRSSLAGPTELAMKH